MANPIQAAQNKVEKVKERLAKMVAIFDKSETKRTETIEKLRTIISKCETKAVEIAAKKEKVLNTIAEDLAKAEKELEDMKASVLQAVQESAQKGE